MTATYGLKKYLISSKMKKKGHWIILEIRIFFPGWNQVF